MLKKKSIIYSLSLLLLLSGCTNNALPWRSGHLVAQLYRQYKQEILLAYNDFAQDMIVDQQHGYARAYFDNYRKQIIFNREGTIEYWINGVQMTTATEEITGYVSEVLINEKYQIGVEILDMDVADLGTDAFDGAKSRIIDLNTRKSVTVPGLLFNRCLIVGDYFYGFTFDDNENKFLDIIDLRTMTHQRIRTTDLITFLYQRGNRVYTQIESTQQAFLLDGLDMIEQPGMYHSELPVLGSSMQILKDIAPRNSTEHWYIEPSAMDELIKQVRLIQISENAIKTTAIKFNRDDIIQIRDVTNYGTHHIAIFLATKSPNDKVHAIISIFDKNGNEVESKEITEILGNDVGQFTYLDYVE